MVVQACGVIREIFGVWAVAALTLVSLFWRFLTSLLKASMTQLVHCSFRYGAGREECGLKIKLIFWYSPPCRLFYWMYGRFYCNCMRGQVFILHVSRTYFKYSGCCRPDGVHRIPAFRIAFCVGKITECIVVSQNILITADCLHCSVLNANMHAATILPKRLSSLFQTEVKNRSTKSIQLVTLTLRLCTKKCRT